MSSAREKSPTAGFDRGYLQIGVGLALLLGLSVFLHAPGLIALMLLTFMLWVSIGAAMVISRFNRGRWE